MPKRIVRNSAIVIVEGKINLESKFIGRGWRM
jgi:hypothetical protein